MLPILSKYLGEKPAHEGKEVIDDNPNEASAGRLQGMDTAFLITASELRDRKTIRRQKRDLLNRSEAIRRLVELGLKAKGK